MGERGEEWAIAQGVIIFFIGVGSIPVIGGLLMLLAGPGLVAAGAGVIAAGAKGLGKSLSPWPAPVEDNKLNTEGIYGMMRHPMYTGEPEGFFCFVTGIVQGARRLEIVRCRLDRDRHLARIRRLPCGFVTTVWHHSDPCLCPLDASSAVVFRDPCVVFAAFRDPRP